MKINIKLHILTLFTFVSGFVSASPDILFLIQTPDTVVIQDTVRIVIKRPRPKPTNNPKMENGEWRTESEKLTIENEELGITNKTQDSLYPTPQTSYLEPFTTELSEGHTNSDSVKNNTTPSSPYSGPGDNTIIQITDKTPHLIPRTSSHPQPNTPYLSPPVIPSDSEEPVQIFKSTNQQKIPAAATFSQDSIFKEKDSEMNTKNFFYGLGASISAFFSSPASAETINNLDHTQSSQQNEIVEQQSSGDSLKTAPFGFFLVPGIGTPTDETDYKINIGLGLIGANAGETEGIQLSLFFNQTKRNVTGLQAAYIFNMAGSVNPGAQASAIFNMSMGNVEGVQGTGIFNMAGGDVKGIQGCGVFNVALGNVDGIQGSGIFNFTKGRVQGVQGTSIINVATNGFTGLQASGITNIIYAKKSIENSSDNTVQATGIINFSNQSTSCQFSGIANISATSNVQITGIYNQTKTLKGFQFGLLNIVDTVEKGVSLGLINIARKGGFYEFEAGYADYANVKLSFKMGTSQRLYTIYSIGYTVTDDELWFAGIGLGHLTKINSHFEFQPELVNYTYCKDPFADIVRYVNATHLKLGVNYIFAKHFGVSLAPSIYFSSQDMNNGNDYKIGSFKPFYEDSFTTNSGTDKWLAKMGFGLSFSVIFR